MKRKRPERKVFSTVGALSFSPSSRRNKEKCLISGIVSSPRVVRKVTKKLPSAPVSLLIFHHKSKKHASDKTHASEVISPQGPTPLALLSLCIFCGRFAFRTIT
jgi:hypothetical protein